MSDLNKQNPAVHGGSIKHQVIHVSEAKVGDRIKFCEELHAYTIQARDERFLVCTKPFNPRKTVLYTIVDLKEDIRGTENLAIGFGAETQEQCEKMLARLQGKAEGFRAPGWATEVSHRNRISLKIAWCRRLQK